MYCIVKDIVKNDPDKNHPWKRYLEKENGRYRFQMDMAIALINYGVSLDWSNPETDERPSYMRKRDWVPCDCPDDDRGQIRCFFCKNGLTHGIAHKVKGAKRPTPSKARKPCSERVSLGYSAYCWYCLEEVKKASPGLKMSDARKQLGAKAKSSNTKACSKFGCTTCNKHVCEKHWEDHGRN